MIVALPVWQGRVSPVFDVAEQLLVVEVCDGHEAARRPERLLQELPESRVQRLQSLGIQMLICGAVSCSLEAALGDAGIEVVPRICGEAEDVLQAFLTSRLDDERYAMPGCCGQRRRHRGGRCRRGRRCEE